jgi:N-acetylmuramate 1-kinase
VTKDSALEAFARRSLPPGSRLTQLKGDASTRRFFRVAPPDAPSIILMLFPEAFDWNDSALRSNHEHFELVGVPVPKILGVFPEQGIVLQEDLGDTTLQAAILADPGCDRASRYREAIDVIVLLQERGTRQLPAAAAARKSALDEAKLRAELEHFYKHFVLGYRGAHPSAGEAAQLASFFGYLAYALDGTPRVLCHRDFQSRNLMVTPGGLKVIDYQDARMGPAAYDLASLLRDSSLDVEEEFREEGIRYFLAQRPALWEEAFREEFERTALQRNIKDLGTFGYQAHHLGNQGYERYIPRTLRMVRQALLRGRRYHGIFEVFEKHVFSGRA